MKVIDARATDADGDTVTYRLEGADAALFEVAMDGGVRLSESMTHRSCLIVGANSYALIVVADDGNGGLGRASPSIWLKERAP